VPARRAANLRLLSSAAIWLKLAFWALRDIISAVAYSQIFLWRYAEGPVMPVVVLIQLSYPIPEFPDICCLLKSAKDYSLFKI
jgi:hypothetical protein